MLEPRLGLDIRIGQEGLEHRGHEIKRGDSVPLNQLNDAFWIPVVAWLGDHQACPNTQRPENLPYRHVEPERRLVQYCIGIGELVGLLHPDHAVGQGIMANGSALGPPGGSRGVNHVGEVLTVQRHRWIGRGVMCHVQPIQLDNAKSIRYRQ